MDFVYILVNIILRRYKYVNKNKKTLIWIKLIIPCQYQLPGAPTKRRSPSYGNKEEGKEK